MWRARREWLGHRGVGGELSGDVDDALVAGLLEDLVRGVLGGRSGGGPASSSERTSPCRRFDERRGARCSPRPSVSIEVDRRTTRARRSDARSTSMAGVARRGRRLRLLEASSKTSLHRVRQLGHAGEAQSSRLIALSSSEALAERSGRTVSRSSGCSSILTTARLSSSRCSLASARKHRLDIRSCPISELPVGEGGGRARRAQWPPGSETRSVEATRKGSPRGRSELPRAAQCSAFRRTGFVEVDDGVLAAEDEGRRPPSWARMRSRSPILEARPMAFMLRAWPRRPPPVPARNHFLELCGAAAGARVPRR